MPLQWSAPLRYAQRHSIADALVSVYAAPRAAAILWAIHLLPIGLLKATHSAYKFLDPCLEWTLWETRALAHAGIGSKNTPMLICACDTSSILRQRIWTCDPGTIIGLFFLGLLVLLNAI